MGALGSSGCEPIRDTGATTGALSGGGTIEFGRLEVVEGVGTRGAVARDWIV
jgi:hypothetical protein